VDKIKESKIMTDKIQQKIQECWQVVDDLKAVYHCERLYDDENEMQNVLLGMFTLYQIKFENLFHEYEKSAAEGKLK
jgi:predicted NUDIX family phosphoesterase